MVNKNSKTQNEMQSYIKIAINKPLGKCRKAMNSIDIEGISTVFIFLWKKF